VVIVIVPYILLIAGFILLIKGAAFLVDGATSIARRLNVSDLVIGLTVVAFGTSCPELFVNVTASMKGNTDIAIGNILGSNIANIFLVLGVASLIYPLKVEKGTVWKEIPLSLLAACVLGVLANDQLIDKSGFSALTMIDGMIFLSFFAIFLYYSFSIAQKTDPVEKLVPATHHRLSVAIFMVVVGLIGLAVGGQWIVSGAVQTALRFGLSESFVGLTIVAIGTSLPELATSSVAAYKRNAEIAVGSVVGSNIYNIFFVLGISSIVKPLPFQAINNTDIGVVILASLLLFICMFTGRRRLLDRWEGLLFLLLYFGYLAFLVVQG